MSTRAQAAEAWCEVYIWFETAPGAAEVLARGFAQVQAALGPPAQGPVARLLRRIAPSPRPAPHPETWMEVWPAVPVAQMPHWLARLEDAVQASGYAQHCGRRHTEIFALPAS